MFGAEFCSMKHSIENLRGIRYKLRMMGIPVKGASYVYGDNMSIVTNVSKPESTSRRSRIRYAIMQYVRLLQWVRPLLPTSQPRRTLLT